MKLLNRCFRSNEEGKGSTGCIFALVLMAIFIFVIFKVGPAYYNNSSFDGDMKQAAARIGSRATTNDAIFKDIIALAKKNQIDLKKEDIKILRLPAQIRLEINYTVPVDFIILRRDLHFSVAAESFTLA